MRTKWIAITFATLSLLLIGGLWAARAPAAAAEPATITVYKTPTCGCCTKWIDHAESNGFEVIAHDVSWERLTEISAEHHVPQALGSCHLSLVEGYAVEGHVPATAIRKLLRERPAVAGIAVPGMPLGSPGMEQGSRKEPYSVIAFTREGGLSVFMRSQ